MSRIPWTKFQDFYLRLGFLKVLVSALSSQRRSALNDAIVRRLEVPLFDAATAHARLWESVQSRITWYPRRTAAGKTVEHPEVAEALLVYGQTESLLYGVTRDTTYKILDWGHNVDFVGRGNQITERGLLLRHLLPQGEVESFFAGDVLAWNPFVLSLEERLFFLYHLVEIDRVTVEIIDLLSDVKPGAVLESSDAARIACRALFRVLDRAQDDIEPRDIPAYRTARELACTIADELDLTEFKADCEAHARRRIPKPMKLSARRSAFLDGSGAKKPRKTTKNADHQTIPRFEQLVDLGFLHKISNDPDAGEAALLEGRRRWRYTPTEACHRWAKAARESNQVRSPFHWHRFAKMAVSAFGREGGLQNREATSSAGELADYLWIAYQRVHRVMGHTPFDSVALHAMINAAADGVIAEMADFHALMLAIKRQGALPDHAFFASGNDLDKMFIQLKSGFREQVRAVPMLLERAGEP
jgi:hypothetical protein